MAERSASTSRIKRQQKFFTRLKAPCQQRYVMENRSSKNKARRAQRYANRFGVNVTIRTRDGLVVIRPTV